MDRRRCRPHRCRTRRAGTLSSRGNGTRLDAAELRSSADAWGGGSCMPQPRIRCPGILPCGVWRVASCVALTLRHLVERDPTAAAARAACYRQHSMFAIVWPGNDGGCDCVVKTVSPYTPWVARGQPGYTEFAGRLADAQYCAFKDAVMTGSGFIEAATDVRQIKRTGNFQRIWIYDWLIERNYRTDRKHQVYNVIERRFLHWISCFSYTDEVRKMCCQKS